MAVAPGHHATLTQTLSGGETGVPVSVTNVTAWMMDAHREFSDITPLGANLEEKAINAIGVAFLIRGFIDQATYPGMFDYSGWILRVLPSGANAGKFFEFFVAVERVKMISSIDQANQFEAVARCIGPVSTSDTDFGDWA